MRRNERACAEEGLRSSVRRTALRPSPCGRDRTRDCGHIGGNGKSRSSRGRPTASRARSAGSAPGSSRDATAGSRPQSFGKVVETSREAGSKYRASLVPVMDDWNRRMPDATEASGCTAFSNPTSPSRFILKPAVRPFYRYTSQSNYRALTGSAVSLQCSFAKRNGVPGIYCFNSLGVIVS